MNAVSSGLKFAVAGTSVLLAGRTRKTRTIIPVIAALAIACSSSSTEPVDANLQADCTTEGRYSLVLTTIDMLTGDTVRAKGTVVLKDGTNTELAAAFPPRYFGPVEQAGTYSITIQVPGYQDWTRSGVVVGRDRCHVQTVQISAGLVSLTAGS